MPLNQTDIALSAEDLAIYRQKGYWISPVLFDGDEVQVMRRELERICAGERDYDGFFWLKQPDFGLDDPAVRQVNNGWWINKVMRIAVKSPILGYIGSQLMDTNEVRIWHDQMLWKPGLGPTGEPTLSNNIGWHQDYEQYPQTNRTHPMVHVFYYLNGLNGEVGDLTLLPRSQGLIFGRGRAPGVRDGRPAGVGCRGSACARLGRDRPLGRAARTPAQAGGRE